jgi:hypothetical protein
MLILGPVFSFCLQRFFAIDFKCCDPAIIACQGVLISLVASLPVVRNFEHSKNRARTRAFHDVARGFHFIDNPLTSDANMHVHAGRFSFVNMVPSGMFSVITGFTRLSHPAIHWQTIETSASAPRNRYSLIHA